MPQMGVALGNGVPGLSGPEWEWGLTHLDIGQELHPRDRIGSSDQVSQGKPSWQGW